MLVVETIAKIRRNHRVAGKSIKAIARERGVSRNTVRKVLRSEATAFRYEQSSCCSTNQPRRWRLPVRRACAASRRSHRSKRTSARGCWLRRKASYALEAEHAAGRYVADPQSRRTNSAGDSIGYLSANARRSWSPVTRKSALDETRDARMGASSGSAGTETSTVAVPTTSQRT